MKDRLLKLIDACKKQIYPNGWPKETLIFHRKIPRKNCPKQLYTYAVSIYDVENINHTN